MLKTYKWHVQMGLKLIPFELIVTFILTMMAALFPSFQTYCLLKVTTLLSGTVQLETDWFWFAALLVSYLLPNLLTFVHAITLNFGVYDKLMSRLKVWFHEQLAMRTLDDYNDASFIENKQKALNVLDWELPGTVLHQGMNIITHFVTIVSLAFVLWQFHYGLLLICAVGFIPSLYITQKNLKRRFELKEKQTASMSRLKYLWQALTKRQIIKENRLMNMQKKIEQEWFKESDLVLSEFQTLEHKNNLWNLCALWLSSLGYIICIISSVILVHRQMIAVASIIASINAFYYFQTKSNSLIQELSAFTNNIGFSANLMAMDRKKHKNTKALLDVKTPLDTVVLNEVCFRYPNQDKDTLKNISLVIHKNETVAIVGRNGSGKSTLANVILGLQKPYKGRVLLGGHDVQTLNTPSVFKQVGVVPQNITRLKGTLSDILQIGTEEPLAEEQWKTAFSKLKFEPMKSNLNGLVGPEFGGLDFSGGEWQKINLARVMVHPYRLTVLDEPTSALDPIIENEVLEGMVNVMADRTNVIISHRMGLCTKVDRILVLEAGEIIENGCHKTLMANKGLYYQMFTSQLS